MKKLFAMSLAICTLGISSVASAYETLYIPGNSGIADQSAPGICSHPIVPQAKMWVDGPTCLIGYPINLPVGKTIDNIQIAYYFGLPGLPGPEIAGYLAENRVQSQLGPIAVAGTNMVQINALGAGYLTMPLLSIPILDGNVYWVQINSSFVEISYVGVTYH